MKTAITALIAVSIILFTTIQYGQIIVTHNSEDQFAVPICVFPVEYISDSTDQVDLTTLLIRTLRRSNYIDVLPLKALIDTMWRYHPTWVAAKEDEWEAFGPLEPIQKITLSQSIAARYCIEPLYDEENGTRRLTLDIYEKSPSPVYTVTAESGSDTPLVDLVEQVADQVDAYFFMLNAPDIVLDAIRKYDANLIDIDALVQQLQEYDRLYQNNVFVLAGLIVAADATRDALLIHDAGTRWRALNNTDRSDQLRFFSALGFNPYIALAEAAIEYGNVEQARLLINEGMASSPFNTAELSALRARLSER